MKKTPSDITRPRREAKPTAKAMVSFIAALAGLLVGLYYFIPNYGNLGVVWTMLCALLAGIFLTRLQALRRGEKKK